VRTGSTYAYPVDLFTPAINTEMAVKSNASRMIRPNILRGPSRVYLVEGVKDVRCAVLVGKLVHHLACSLRTFPWRFEVCGGSQWRMFVLCCTPSKHRRPGLRAKEILWCVTVCIYLYLAEIPTLHGLFKRFQLLHHYLATGTRHIKLETPLAHRNSAFGTTSGQSERYGRRVSLCASKRLLGVTIKEQFLLTGSLLGGACFELDNVCCSLVAIQNGGRTYRW